MASDQSSPPGQETPPQRLVPKVAYWRQNLCVIAVLLTIWWLISFGCSALWIKTLNQFTIGTLPLGFWIAQQGGMFVFLVLILVYALIMDYLDRKHDVRE